MASGIKSAGVGLAEVYTATPSIGVTGGSGRAFTQVATILVDAFCSRSTWINLTLIKVCAPSVWVPHITLLARAGIVSSIVGTQGIGTAGVGLLTLVNITTLNLAISFESRFTLADVLRW